VTLLAQRGRIRFAGIAVAWLLEACAGSGSGAEPVNSDVPGAAITRIAEQTPIVFMSDRAREGVSDLYVMSAAGGNIQRLTKEGGFHVPSWSPDGASIAFRQVVDGVRADVGVLTPDDGSASVLLTHGENARTARLPLDWSVTGATVAYASWPELDNMIVWAVPKAGGEPTRVLADFPCCQQSVAWSVDGKQIAYLTFQEQRTLDLWLASESAGAEPVNLTRGRIYAPITPRWSPDGTRLALSGYAMTADGGVEGLEEHRSDRSFFPDTEIFVLTVASGELTRLTDNEAEDFAPTWSPDGAELLISSDRDGDLDLWLLPVEAPDQARNLIDDAAAPHQDEFPSWYGPGRQATP
jgi:TolB protein